MFARCNCVGILIRANTVRPYDITYTRLGKFEFIGELLFNISNNDGLAVIAQRGGQSHGNTGTGHRLTKINPQVLVQNLCHDVPTAGRSVPGEQDGQAAHQTGNCQNQADSCPKAFFIMITSLCKKAAAQKDSGFEFQQFLNYRRVEKCLMVRHI